MKTKYLIVPIIAVLLGVMTSCDDFLVEDSRDTLTPETFFQNGEEAQLALNGLQGQMTAGSGMDELLGTDMGVYGRNKASGSMFIGIYEYDQEWRVVEGRWSTPFAGVRDANFLLSGVEKSSLTDEIKGRSIALGLFYRARFYWDLTVNFGDVPYWRDAVVMEDVAPLGKTSAATIQEEMIADLDEAIKSGYMSTLKWNDDANLSMPTVWAARMLKAYYHIWLEQWDEASVELNAIVSSEPYNMELGPYPDMYREGNEKHDELIFAKEFLGSSTNGQNGNGMVNARFNKAGDPAAVVLLNELGISTHTGGQTLRKSFADTYAMDDARRIYNVMDYYVTVSDNDTIENDTAFFNFTYMPKLMRAVVPVSDPLLTVNDVNKQSSVPARIFTLSEAYLCLAEAEYMKGETSTAASLAAINKVRVRAELDPLTTMTHEDIREERAWELASEGFTGRKKDLIRWGMLEATVLATPAAERAAGAPQIAIDRAMDDSVIIANAPIGKFQVLPVPLAELVKSEQIGGGLVQNPIWVD